MRHWTQGYTRHQSSELEDEHSPLRLDVKFLGEVLGHTLREYEGESIFADVEQIRNLSKSACSGDEQAGRQLRELLQSLPDETLITIARSFGHFLNLANIAEDHHKIRKWRYSHPNALAQIYQQLLDEGTTENDILQALSEMRIDLVLTAHPTEAARRTQIKKLDNIESLLGALDSESITDFERRNDTENLIREIISLWHTPEIRTGRPTPVEEAKWGFTVIEQSLWFALPEFLRNLDQIFESRNLARLGHHFCPVRFSSWIGGDRDGNPNVTVAITEEVCLLARWKAMDLYLRDIEALRGELSMSLCSDELRQVSGDAHEPYRTLLKQVRTSIENTRHWLEDQLEQASSAPVDAIHCTDDLLQPLELCYRSLCESGMGFIARGKLLDCIRRLQCFGVCLLRLDVRQEAALHASLMSQVTQYLELGDYLQWSEQEKNEFLLKELQSRRPLIEADFQLEDPQLQEVLATFRMIARQPEESLGRYVISMASLPSDVLCVYLLQKMVGVKQALPVVPLFETLAALNRAPECIRDLLSMPFYRALIVGHQEVMIGYSDSAKDAGFLAASWWQYLCHQSIHAVCESFNVKVNFFHGRGGTVSRGGASAHQAFQSLPSGALTGKIRITEQGEIIRFKYGRPELAEMHLELYTGAMLKALLKSGQNADPWRETMAEMARLAEDDYRKLVHQNPLLMRYLNEVTPQNELQQLPLSSRPAKRKVSGGFASLRAIPWVFAWTQVRLMLPAWLGVDVALSVMKEQGRLKELQKMYQAWPYFRSLVDMLEMVLAKTDASITTYYEDALGSAELKQLGTQLRQRLEQLIELIKQINGQQELLGAHPDIAKSIRLRNPYVDPINIVQVELMKRARLGEFLSESQKALIEKGLMITITGIAAGMRNTG